MHDRPRARTMSLARVVLCSGRSVDLAELRLSSTYRGMNDAEGALREVDWEGLARDCEL